MTTPNTELGQLSPVTQDYLKIIWTGQEWSAEPITPKLIAARLAVAPSTVSETLKRLVESGLITHTPYGAIELTEVGQRLAVQIVRRHRVLETFLVERLGYTWDEVHDEAEILEHAVTDRLINRMDANLGHPQRDPHGDPIPDRHGVSAKHDGVSLWVAGAGTWMLCRISDDDPELLRFFTAAGLQVDTEIEVSGRPEITGVLTVTAPGLPEPLQLGQVAALAIWVHDSAHFVH